MVKHAAGVNKANNKENTNVSQYWPFVRGIRHKGPLMRKSFPYHDIKRDQLNARAILNGRCKLDNFIYFFFLNEPRGWLKGIYAKIYALYVKLRQIKGTAYFW